MIVSETSIQSWLALQRQLIPGLLHAYVNLEGTSVEQQAITVTHPADLARSKELVLAAKLTVASKSPVTSVIKNKPDQASILRIAYPLSLGKSANGALVVEVIATMEKQNALIKVIGWGERWLVFALENFYKKTPVTSYKQILEGALEQPSYDDSVAFMLALLPTKVGCTRIAIGHLQKNQIQIEAISDVSSLDTRSSRVTCIRDAMQEAHDIGQTVVWVNNHENTTGAPKHSQLANVGNLEAVCTVPLNVRSTRGSVFCFEFVRPVDSAQKTIEGCDEAASILNPALELQYEHKRNWWRRQYSLLHHGLSSLIDPKSRSKNAVVACFCLLTCFFLLSQAEYQVKAEAVLEGAIQRAVVAPFDGFISKASYQASHTVSKGDILAQLDDRELKGQLRKLASEGAEYEKQHNHALASLDHVEAKIIEAKYQQLNAEQSMLAEQLERTRLRAPLDGVIISGDWSRKLGVPVNKGDLLFQVAPLDQYRVNLLVSDKDISQLEIGQTGKLVLTSLPKERLSFRVSSISTVSEGESGQPVFRVDGSLADTIGNYRPGMQGVARVSVGERRRLWIWTHKLTDWLTLRFWQLRP